MVVAVHHEGGRAVVGVHRVRKAVPQLTAESVWRVWRNHAGPRVRRLAIHELIAGLEIVGPGVKRQAREDVDTRRRPMQEVGRGNGMLTAHQVEGRNRARLDVVLRAPLLVAVQEAARGVEQQIVLQHRRPPGLDDVAVDGLVNRGVAVDEVGDRAGVLRPIELPLVVEVVQEMQLAVAPRLPRHLGGDVAHQVLVLGARSIQVVRADAILSQRRDRPGDREPEPVRHDRPGDGPRVVEDPERLRARHQVGIGDPRSRRHRRQQISERLPRQVVPRGVLAAAAEAVRSRATGCCRSW